VVVELEEEELEELEEPDVLFELELDEVPDVALPAVDDDELVEPVADDEPLVPVVEEAAPLPALVRMGGSGARLHVISFPMRVSRARVNRLCSTVSRPAWTCFSCTSIATYRAAMSSTPMTVDSSTSRSVKAERRVLEP
jgi:hypothetical protein